MCKEDTVIDGRVGEVEIAECGGKGFVPEVAALA